MLVVPSLVDEGKKGYDLRIEDNEGKFVFYQYKRANYITRSSGNYWGSYNQKYYEIKVHKMKKTKEMYNQHNLLKQLANSNELVYYVAPKFQDFSELEDGRDIVSESIYIDLADPTLPLIDSTDRSQHSITYLLGGNNINWHSKPTKLPYIEHRKNPIEDILNKTNYKINDHYINNFINRIEKIKNISFDKFQFEKKSKYPFTQKVFNIFKVMILEFNVFPMLYVDAKL